MTTFRISPDAESLSYCPDLVAQLLENVMPNKVKNSSMPCPKTFSTKQKKQPQYIGQQAVAGPG